MAGAGLIPFGSVRLDFVTLLAAALAAGCGGGQTGGASANDVESQGGSSQGGGASAGGGEDGESGPSLPSCDDGTCFRCGEGICPKGFYCDQSAGACSWLPSCPEEASCGCVQNALGSSCSCQEKGGGAMVRCE